MEEGQGGSSSGETEYEPLTSFMEALHALQTVEVLIYVHDIMNKTKRISIILKSYYSV
jgi:hypothetical protein